MKIVFFFKAEHSLEIVIFDFCFLSNKNTLFVTDDITKIFNLAAEEHCSLFYKSTDNAGEWVFLSCVYVCVCPSLYT